MDLGKLKAASEAGDAGTWVEKPNDLDCDVLVRGYSHPAVKGAIGRALRRAPKEWLDDDGLLREEKVDEIDREIYADHVLLGWRGITSDGKDLEVTRENKLELLSVTDFFDAVKVAAAQSTQAHKDRLASLMGNSPAPSRPATRAKK